MTGRDSTMLKSLDISRSALIAQRERMNVISGNISQVSIHNKPGEEPFYRRYVEFKEGRGDGGNQIDYEVKIDKSAPRLVYKPNHPDAVDGYVSYPNINEMSEIADAMLASNAYLANIQAMTMTRQMAEQTLRLLQ